MKRSGSVASNSNPGLNQGSLSPLRLHALVLGAGAGSRFGGGKLLASHNGDFLIESALQAAFASPVEGVTLVTGYDNARVEAVARAFAQRHVPSPPLRIVYASAYENGMAFSLRAAIAALPANVDGAFVFLGDMPSTPWSIALQLAEAIGGRAAAAPVFEGRRGHPVLFAARLFPTLLALTGDQGARDVLDRLGVDLALVDAEDAGILFDVDWRSDLKPALANAVLERACR